MTSPVPPPPIEPDGKDWTWVLERACPECGFDATRVRAADLTGLIEENSAGWRAALTMPGVRIRPEADVWSALEYACHVRDVHRLFDERVHLMLDQDDPLFANWDQDETALADRYDLQDPATVAAELTAAAEAVAAT